MFAVIKTGGKQYKVTADQIIKVEKLEAEVGSEVEFDALLTEKDGVVTVGCPIVEGVKVKAEVVSQGKADKVLVYKYKAKKRVRRAQGHRQPFTALKIKSVG